MISEKIEKAINAQINAELYSSYLYLSMNSWFANVSLTGFAQWMKVQAQEEASHAMILYQYLLDRGGRVLLAPIEQPQQEWDCAKCVFEDVYKHEQYVTSLINEIVTLAMDEKDHATVAALQWFVTEQVEEEASALEILDHLKLIGEDKSALLMKDKELLARTFTLPAQLTGKF